RLAACVCRSLRRGCGASCRIRAHGWERRRICRLSRSARACPTRGVRAARSRGSTPSLPHAPNRVRASTAMTNESVAVVEGDETYRNEELLADVIAGLIGDARHVAVGASSPIPAAAALLARERGRGRPYVSLLGSRRQTFFTDGGRELFDCAGQGRIDAFFLSGGQIDGEGNINLVAIGEYARPQVRFPGSFGSAYLYYVVPKVILFR